MKEKRIPRHKIVFAEIKPSPPAPKDNQPYNRFIDLPGETRDGRPILGDILFVLGDRELRNAAFNGALSINNDFYAKAEVDEESKKAVMRELTAKVALIKERMFDNRPEKREHASSAAILFLIEATKRYKELQEEGSYQ